MVQAINWGYNVIDLEAIVEKYHTSEEIRPFEMNVSGFHGVRTAFELPSNTAFKIAHNGRVAYGTLDTGDPGDPPKIFPSPKGVTFLADEKYWFSGRLEESPPEGATNFWPIKVTEATGGGGAHNTAFGQQIYLSEINNSGIEVKLVVPVGHSLIQGRLPEGLKYIPLAGVQDDAVTSNLNFAPAHGRKVTLRTKSKAPEIEARDLSISNGDVVVLNTVRDLDYLGMLEGILRSNPEVRLFLSATDSMMQSIGKDKVWELIKRSEVYVSNREELETLVGKRVNDSQTLAVMMNHVQSTLLARDGSLGRVYITLGHSGSVALGQERVLYYQAPASGNIGPFKKLEIVNTNGCGDAYLAVVVIKEIFGHPTMEILDYANAAGHICATLPTASGTSMATEGRIESFRKKFGNPDLHRYDLRQGDFVRIRR